MPKLLSYLVEHISVLAVLTPPTTESPSMCLILYSRPCSGPTHLCCNEDGITQDLGHWCTLQTRPTSAGVGGAATLHSPQRVGVGVVPVRRGETCHFCMQCINSINSYYTSAHVVRLRGSACTPNKGSYLRDCFTALNAGSWGWSCLTCSVRHVTSLHAQSPMLQWCLFTLMC